MTKQVQRRRGTATQHTSFTGAEGELSVNTTNKSVHVHDNVTAGGFEAARVDMDNVTSSSILTAAGITATTTELNYVDGVTSAIQTQIDGKAGTASPTFTGTLAAAAITSTGVGVTGNITVSGTVDGRDVATDGTKLDGIEASADVTDLANVTAAGALMATGGSVTGDISFGDNDKAIFGDGSDLTISHDTTGTVGSYITEAGTGSLNIRGQNIIFANADGSEEYGKFFNGAGVEFNYADITKLATTSTGVDISGTLTSDGLTVNSGAANTVALFQSTDSVASIYLVDSNTTGGSSASQGLITTGNNLAVRAVNNVIIETGTSEAMRISSDGSVGIGTSSPSNLLDIQSSTASGGMLELNNTGDTSRMLFISNSDGMIIRSNNSTSGAVAKDTIFQQGTVEAMRISSDGSVGIGTTSPSSQLHIKDHLGNAITLESTVNNGNDASFKFKKARGGSGSLATIVAGDDLGTIEWYGYDGSAYNIAASIKADSTTNTGDFNADLIFNTGSEAMRIDSSGNVGIGVVPTNVSGYTCLDIGADSTGSFIELDSVSGMYHRFINNNGQLLIQADQGDSAANSAIIHYVDGSERMRIDSSGNVGIGTATPTAPLHIETSADGNMLQMNGASDVWELIARSSNGASPLSGEVVYSLGMYRGDGASSPNGVINFGRGPSSQNGYLTFDVNGSEAMRISSSGSVGIGTSSPGHLLDVEGNSDVVMRIGSTGTGDADAALHIDGGDTGESFIRFDTDGAQGARISMTGGAGGKLNIQTTASSGREIDFEPNETLTMQVVTPASGTNTTDILEFFAGGTSAGKISAMDGDLVIGEDAVGIKFENTGADRIIPVNVDTLAIRDNAIDLGGPAERWNDAYIKNGVTEGSDGNDKQDIRDLTEAEQRVAVACKGLLKAWRWKSAVEEKGDNARIHCGIIAQDLQAAFAAEGLDAGRYAMFM